MTADQAARWSFHTVNYGARPFATFADELSEASLNQVGIAMAQVRAGDLRKNLASIARFRVTDLVQPAAFTLHEPERWSAERDALRAGLDTAARIAAPVFYTTTGPAIGLGWDESVRRFCEAVAPVRHYARVTTRATWGCGSPWRTPRRCGSI